MELVSNGQFWLSDMPEVRQAACFVCTCVEGWRVQGPRVVCSRSGWGREGSV